jgi:hypothetical protein
MSGEMQSVVSAILFQLTVEAVPMALATVSYMLPWVNRSLATLRERLWVSYYTGIIDLLDHI